MLASNSRIFRIFNFTLCFILSCQTPFFPFRSTVRSASLHVLLVCRIPLHSPLAVPTSPALGHDSPGSVLNFLHILCLIRGCETLLRHYSISICLYTGALLTAYVAYSSSLRGSAELEKPCIQEACAVDNRPVCMPYEGSQETAL